MKLKITIGKLNQVDQFTPIVQSEYEAKDAEQSMNAFKKFFSDHSDVSLPQDVELILQSGDPWKVSTILSIKFFLAEAGMGLEYYAFSDDEETVLDDVTTSSGLLLLDEAQMFYGFIPRGYYLRFNSEEDANPIKVYAWIGDKVRLFPSVSSDPYNASLQQVKELSQIMGSISTPVVSKFMKFLAAFKKRVIII